MFDKRKDDSRKDDSEPNTAAAKQGQERPVSKVATATAIAKPALIGAGIHVNGDISGTENLVIEGKVEGKVDLAGSQVEIGETGKVAADIIAKTIKIDGSLQGDVQGKERVVISKSGRVKGNITAPRVMLEDGAIFKGSIDINPSESQVAELPLPSKSDAEADAGKAKPGAANKDGNYSGKN